MKSARVALLVCFGAVATLLWVAHQPLLSARVVQKEDKNDKRAADREAIKAANTKLLAAFTKGDAKQPLRWRPGGIWYRSNWPVISVWCGFPIQPIYYDYGGNVVYQGDTVYYQGDPLASAVDYANQALAIANLGRNVNLNVNEEWQPLGVFAMVQGQESSPNLIVQLAINKGGILRGNFYNALTDSNTPIFGGVDPQTQRAAWTMGDKQMPVYETALANLTQEQASMLVHFGPDSTQQWTLVRMQNNQPPGP